MFRNSEGVRSSEDGQVMCRGLSQGIGWSNGFWQSIGFRNSEGVGSSEDGQDMCGGLSQGFGRSNGFWHSIGFRNCKGFQASMRVVPSEGVRPRINERID